MFQILVSHIDCYFITLLANFLQRNVLVYVICLSLTHLMLMYRVLHKVK